MTDDYKNDEDSPLHYEGGLPLLPGPADREKADRAREKIEDRQYKNDQTSIQRGILWTQRALVVFGILGAAVSTYQAISAKHSADKAEVASQTATNQAWQVVGNINWLARSMDWSQKVTQQGIESSGQQARETLGALREQTRLDQRAWVVLRTLGPGPQLNQQWNLDVHFTNTGKTPAKGARLRCTAEWSYKDEEHLKWYRQPYGEPFLVSPNDDRICTLHPMGSAASQSDLDIIQRTDWRLFVYGSVVYKDISGQAQWLTFCRIMQPDSRVFTDCQKGNDTGEGQPPSPFSGPPNAPANFNFPVLPTQ